MCGIMWCSGDGNVHSRTLGQLLMFVMGLPLLEWVTIIHSPERAGTHIIPIYCLVVSVLPTVVFKANKSYFLFHLFDEDKKK